MPLGTFPLIIASTRETLMFLEQLYCFEQYGLDSKIKEILADELIQMMMRADHVDPSVLESLLRALARRQYQCGGSLEYHPAQNLSGTGDTFLRFRGSLKCDLY